MSTLNWRTARSIELVEPLIPNPSASHQKLDRLDEAQVAFDGGLVHIDPRPVGATDTEYPVYVVPASAVKVIQYQDRKRPSKLSGF